MKSEAKDRNRVTRDRVKELETKITQLRGTNEVLVRQGQSLQQKLAQNNTEIIKYQGGIEELKKTLA